MKSNGQPSPYAVSRRSVLGIMTAAVAAPVLAHTALDATTASAAPGAGQAALPAPLRQLTKPNLSLTRVATITGAAHRITFQLATWDGGRAYVRDVEVRVGGAWRMVTDPRHRFEEQWVVLVADEGTPGDYYTSMTPQWVGLDALRKVDHQTVELGNDAPGQHHLTVRWSVAGPDPLVRATVTARRAGQHVIGYQGGNANDMEQVTEVLCGTRQHARFVEGAEALGAWELMAPMALVQTGTGGDAMTCGLFVAPGSLPFVHERELGRDRQPFGMSLRNDARRVQPVAFAPQAGERAVLAVGGRSTFTFGLLARPGTVTAAYEHLARVQYRYDRYRRNVYGTSMTQTVLNLLDLIKVEPAARPDGGFVPSPSGWWARAKSFCDPEHDQAIRTSTAAVLLGASLLTDDADLYQRRGRPMMEFHLSRENHAWTPVKGKITEGSTSYYRLGGLPGDASTLVPLYRMTGEQHAGVHALAMREIRQRRAKGSRTPMSTPLQAYALTGNKAYLAEALAEARRYVRREVDPPYTTNQAENGFQYNYAKAWTELFLVAELTQDAGVLAAARTEARRFITQTQLRPVPSDDVTVRVPHQPFIDNQADLWKDSPGIFDYPRTEVPTETVPAWSVSTNGVTFEQLTTYKVATTDNPGGGLSMIPAWAPFLARLADRTGDPLLRDVAHNLVVGRYTNYPGYYNRQYTVAHMKPDFPLQGPPGVSSIYYSHIPAQLGMSIDHLISRHVIRSRGRIVMPSEFETNYVFFRFGLYGHRPGRFYGVDDVWLSLRPGTVRLSTSQVDWVAGLADRTLCVSLTNAGPKPQPVSVELDRSLVPATRYAVDIWHDDKGPVRSTAVDGKVAVTVPGHGITALVVRDVEVSPPRHARPRYPYRGTQGYHLDEDNTHGAQRAMLLVRPDGSGYDAYVQLNSEKLATLRYRIDDGDPVAVPTRFYPNEWTVPVATVGSAFTFEVLVEGSPTLPEPVTLRLASAVTGACPPGVPVCGEVSCPADLTPGDTFRVVLRVRAGAAAVTGLATRLALPTGWTSKVITPGDASLAAGATTAWVLDVNASQAVTPGAVTFSGQASWDGGEVALEAADVEVLKPVRLSSLLLEPSMVPVGGGEVTVTASVLNVGPVDRDTTATVVLPAGWAGTPADQAVAVRARGEADVRFTVTVPDTAAPGSQGRVAVRLPDGGEVAGTVRVASTDVVVDNADPWPRYAETGWWSSSSLRGWNGTNSRYSMDNKLGGTATWRPDLPKAGRYLVAVWYPSNSQTTTQAVYVVRHAGGEERFVVNQQEQFDQWRELGTFQFDAGTDGHVQIRVEDTAFHRVDAALFRPAT